MTTIRRLIFLSVMALSIMHPSMLYPAGSAEAPAACPGTISVTGNSFDYYAPDTVEIVLAVESRNISASGAAANNRAVMDKVFTGLKQVLDPGQDRVKTVSYSLQPAYEYDRKQEKNLLAGYTAANQISVRTKKIDKAGDVIDIAISSGANRVQSVHFSIVETKELCRTLLSKAAGHARDEAGTVASSLDTKITGIREASSNCGTLETTPVIRHDMMLESAAARATTPIEAGDIKLTATVRTVFTIK